MTGQNAPRPGSAAARVDRKGSIGAKQRAAGAAAATGPFQRKLKRVAIGGMGLLGPGVAAELALHGIEVRVWNDPKWCKGKSAADFSKAKVL